MFNSIFGKQDERYREEQSMSNGNYHYTITRNYGNLVGKRSQGWSYSVDGKFVGTTARSVYDYIKNAHRTRMIACLSPSLREVTNATRALAEWSHEPVDLTHYPVSAEWRVEKVS